MRPRSVVRVVASLLMVAALPCMWSFLYIPPPQAQQLSETLQRLPRPPSPPAPPPAPLRCPIASSSRNTVRPELTSTPVHVAVAKCNPAAELLAQITLYDTSWNSSCRCVCVARCEISCGFPAAMSMHVYGFPFSEGSLTVRDGLETLASVSLALFRPWPQGWSVISVWPHPQSDSLLRVVAFPFRYHTCHRCTFASPDGKVVESTAGVVVDNTLLDCQRPAAPELSRPGTLLTVSLSDDIAMLPFALGADSVASLPPVKLAVCCYLAREPPSTLIEWLAYTRAAGVERIIVYDNERSNAARPIVREVFAAFSDLVVVRPWAPLHSHPEAMTDCIYRYGPTAEWMLLIDADEYLVPDAGTTVRAVVERLRGPIVTLARRHFGPCESAGPAPAGAMPLLAERCRLHVPRGLDTELPKPLFKTAGATSVLEFTPHFVRHSAFDRPVTSHSQTLTVLPGGLRVAHLGFMGEAEYVARRLGEEPIFLITRSEATVRAAFAKARADGVDGDGDAVTVGLRAAADAVRAEIRARPGMEALWRRWRGLGSPGNGTLQA